MSNEFPEDANKNYSPKNSYPEKVQSLSERVAVLESEQKHLKEIHSTNKDNITEKIDNLKTAIDKQDQRISSLEKLKWQAVGVVAFIVFIVGAIKVFGTQ